MLHDGKGGSRHFSVLGFGMFEDMFLDAHHAKKRSGPLRWFDRLEALVHDLDMAHDGMFDARRDQLRKLYECCVKLEAGLEERANAQPIE